ncbi:MAG: hypothetical protein AAFW81_06925 [Pseudomonadota bacterium]
MLKKVLALIALLGISVSTSGCVFALGAAAGAIAADELTEGDGEFDPLEEAYDGDDSTEPLIDDDIDND